MTDVDVQTPSPVTGLSLEDVVALTPSERALLRDWTIEQSGGDERDFLPNAIRRMSLDVRMKLAASETLTRAWHAREIQRVSSSFVYFTEQYGSLQPPKGPPIPFTLWPAQIPAAHALATSAVVALPKARRMGISWLAMHRVDWIVEHDPEGEYARALILSKGLGDAKEMLKRVKAIHALQPPWMRAPADDTDNTQEWHARHASVKSLPATEAAARSETASIVILDEFAFVRNRGAEGIRIAAEPTAEGGGQIVYVSTGNGEVGDGAEFARLCRLAQTGAPEAPTMVFLPASARPDRSAQMIAARHEDGMVAEYAETLDQALAGDRTIHVYEPSWLDAAQHVARDLESDAKLMRHLIEQGFEWGTDWGDFQTFTVYGVDLPGGGVFIVDELIQPHTEPENASESIILHDPAGHRAPDSGKAHAIRSNQDAAPAGTNATYAQVLRRLRDRPEYAGRLPEQALRIPFGQYKQAGGDRGIADTVGYLRWAFTRTAKHVADGKGARDLHGGIAVSPRCTLLLRQLRNLERDPDTGKVRKPPLDPKRPEIGDHGPDALVALCAVPRAVNWTMQRHHTTETT